jgi:NADH-quinone oxidoreductase subunit J
MLNLLFYFFSIVLLLSALAVVLTHNSIVSVLFLVLSFLISAILLILLECEFLALMLIIIYVGAVAILFLFVLMMLETKLKNLNKNIFIYFPFGVFINAVFFIEITNSISNSFLANPYINNFLYNTYCSWYGKVDSITDIEVFGSILYTHYVLQFLVVGFILFLALVGVVFLTSNSVKNHKNQVVFHQLSRNSVIF